MSVKRILSVAAVSSFSFVHVYSTATYNDAQPCLQGSCSISIEDSPAKVFGSLVINGQTASISDISEAAGWTVWNCERSPGSQEIRLACTGESELCAHVFQDGAVDTIVRLPESCGIGPFARIAKSRDVVKEILPSHVSEVATNSRKPPPSIHAFTIDTDFGKISTGRGNVQFVISATNLPDQSAYLGKEALQEGLRRRSSMKFGKRGWINEFFQHLTAVNSTHKAVQKVNISKSSSLVNMDVECGQVTGHVDVDVDASVQASISYGYIVVGTLVPLHIEGLS
ncbi:hypothetical protein FRC02_004712 [Tulasnella sp. 418]|nr:hypothetical protein FRC02_004712 [Tulasnella sp. 418]